ncbi:hypothetical protein BGZ96_005202 [Linnemannia gamsii]|uniref:Uncharacterized protein n=1 Tax=Linnemannia gamsii TaxID=64522 RepID=A0ABQ7K5S5_9FUNG|nr:hypothetical protein BGZ96_005202 [Linnemannia gamsii]
MNEAGFIAVPVCKGLEDSKVSRGSEMHKACWCPTWSDVCVKSGMCSAEAKEVYVQMIAGATAQPGFCDGVATSAAGRNRLCRVSSSSKVTGAGVVALAVAGALL